jgi:predicted DNA-binding protein YlxM (UPF0122 family)
LPNQNKSIQALEEKSLPTSYDRAVLTARNVMIYIDRLSGMSFDEIAEKYGIVRGSVSHHIKRCEQELHDLTPEKMQLGLRSYYGVASHRLLQLIHSDDENVAVKATLGTLKGLQALVPKVINDKKVLNVNAKIRAELGLLDSTAVDTEYSVLDTDSDNSTVHVQDTVYVQNAIHDDDTVHMDDSAIYTQHATDTVSSTQDTSMPIHTTDTSSTLDSATDATAHLPQSNMDTPVGDTDRRCGTSGTEPSITAQKIFTETKSD